MDASSGLSMGSLKGALNSQTFGAQVVTKTIDYMNQKHNSFGANNDFDFQTKVLGAAFTGKGTMMDMSV